MKPDKKSRQTGYEYEKVAENFFIQNGYRILERNWMAGHKEIDLIASNDKLIVFIEVKSSRNLKFGHPSEKVDKRKRHNLISAARQYIIAKDLDGYDFRFDLVTFLGGKLEHYPDAFQVE